MKHRVLRLSVKFHEHDKYPGDQRCNDQRQERYKNCFILSAKNVVREDKNSRGSDNDEDQTHPVEEVNTR